MKNLISRSLQLIVVAAALLLAGSVQAQAPGGRAAQPAVRTPAPPAPEWHARTATTLAKAITEERPIVLCFVDDKSDEPFKTDGMLELSKQNACFVKAVVTDGEAETREKWQAPECAFFAQHPSAAYGVKKGQLPVLVCDWFGNEFYRAANAGKLSAENLTKLIGNTPVLVSELQARLQKCFDQASKDLTDGKTSSGFKNLLRVFNEQCWGYDVLQDAIELYNTTINKGRGRLEWNVQHKRLEALQEQWKGFKNTELGAEIKSAIEDLTESFAPEKEGEF